jgi:hypothetical protein
MKQFLSALAGAALCAFAAAPADAQSEDRRHYMRGEFHPGGLNSASRPVVSPTGAMSGVVGDADTRLQDKAFLGVDIAYSMEAWRLLGSPVQACNITWRHRGGQGERLTEEIYLELPRQGASLGLSGEELIALAEHPAIRAYATGSTVFGLYVRQDALRTQPRVFNLDFWAMDLDERGSQHPFYLRCLSGALGGAGAEGYNTPYAFDLDEVFLDLDDERAARELYAYITEEAGSDRPSDYRRSNHVYLTDIDFDIQPVVNFLARTALEQAREARAEADALAQRRREQQEQAAAAEAEARRRAEQARLESAAAGGAQPANAEYANAFDRLRASVQADLAETRPDAAPPPPRPVASVVIPGETVGEQALADAIALAEAREESAATLERRLADFVSPPERNTGQLEPDTREYELRRGDVRTSSIMGGGSIAMGEVSGACGVGWVKQYPDTWVLLVGGNADLRFDGTSQQDMTLLIQTPGGEWRCDDDSGGNLNPRIDITNAEPGEYRVWIGRYVGPGEADTSLTVRAQ